MTDNLDEFVSKSPLLKNNLIVLERTENSDLVEASKPCNKEFFEKIFSTQGPFWSAYSELGFSHAPFGAEYLSFVNDRMFFCKNLEKHFFYSVGPKKKFFFDKGKLSEKHFFSFDNLLLFFSTPFDFARQVSSIALASLKINEELESFEDFSVKTKKFWLANKERKIDDHLSLAREALNGAVLAMRYSFFSSLAYSLKIKLKKSPSWLECEAQEFSKAVNLGNAGFEKAKNDFGFYSQNPYDISLPRLGELDAPQWPTGLKFPVSPAARWRENSKFLCARYLAVERKAYLGFAQKTGLLGDVFFLKSSELSDKNNSLSEIAKQRKKNFLENLNKPTPKRIFFDKKWFFEENLSEKSISGLPAGGAYTVEGTVVTVDAEEDYKKSVEGKIVLSKTLSPNLTILFGKIRGVVSESGGKVSHAAIIALEQELPCVVQTKNIGLINEGDEIRVDGKTGKIEITKKKTSNNKTT